MYTFNFTYQDGQNKYFEHINEVKYYIRSDYMVSGDDILKYRFPIGPTLHLFSDSSNISVSGNNLLYIEVKKE